MFMGVDIRDNLDNMGVEELDTYVSNYKVNLKNL